MLSDKKCDTNFCGNIATTQLVITGKKTLWLCGVHAKAKLKKIKK